MSLKIIKNHTSITTGILFLISRTFFTIFVVVPYTLHWSFVKVQIDLIFYYSLILMLKTLNNYIKENKHANEQTKINQTCFTDRNIGILRLA